MNTPTPEEWLEKILDDEADAADRAAADDDYFEWRAEEEARRIDDMANYS
jgi:hypothetical protein